MSEKKIRKPSLAHMQKTADSIADAEKHVHLASDGLKLEWDECECGRTKAKSEKLCYGCRHSG